MLLMVYSLANLHVVTWGTREVAKATPTTAQGQGQKKEAVQQKPTGMLEGFLGKANMWRAFCCPTTTSNDLESDLKFKVILDKLEAMDARLTNLAAHGGDARPDSHTQKSSGIGTDRDLSSEDAGSDENENQELELQDIGQEMKTAVPWIDDTSSVGTGGKEEITVEESQFWRQLIDTYLFPLESNEQQKKKLQDELLEMRNKIKSEARQRFQGFEKHSLSTILKMSRDEESKGLIIKRAVEVSDRWRQGVAKIIARRRHDHDAMTRSHPSHSNQTQLDRPVLLHLEQETTNTQQHGPQHLDPRLLAPGPVTTSDARSSPALSARSGQSVGNMSRVSEVSNTGSDAQLSFIERLRNLYQTNEDNDGEKDGPAE
ncbi:chitin synthase [Plakobranchus ocellatus]|uniref:Chitin synthase n=1 Tax=Plakobranchus ocellatus TaxID=259542 RepID=A0AAV4B1V8_9GAST|nr:chitin synthase [Plakobranchus ocellatus]